MSLRILLVDDEEIVHQTIGDYLRECDHHVDGVLDGLDALHAIEEREYDVALLDVRMPGMDGLTLLARARELCPQMGVIIITGHGDVEMERQVLEQGAAGFFIKPISLRQLDALLTELDA